MGTRIETTTKTESEIAIIWSFGEFPMIIEDEMGGNKNTHTAIKRNLGEFPRSMWHFVFSSLSLSQKEGLDP